MSGKWLLKGAGIVVLYIAIVALLYTVSNRPNSMAADYAAALRQGTVCETARIDSICTKEFAKGWSSRLSAEDTGEVLELLSGYDFAAKAERSFMSCIPLESRPTYQIQFQDGSRLTLAYMKPYFVMGNKLYQLGEGGDVWLEEFRVCYAADCAKY